jgi:thiamine-monophosphate kinase
MGEFELIRRYFAEAACARPSSGVALGIGDDAALLNLPADEQLVISTDSQVVGVHFPHQADPFLLAQRALACAASDLAAMGARPIAFTLALSLPQFDADWLQGFARGLDCMAQSCGLALVGGDTTRGPLNINISVFGGVPCGQALTRSGARVGDLLCVGGYLGEAAAALPLVLGERQLDAQLAAPLLARYWTPQPQLALGQALRGKASAALDISDGLLADCGHIARASGVALQIELERLPLAAATLAVVELQQARQYALNGGDDYRLAFTLPSVQLAPLQADGWQVWPIGRVEAGQGVQLIDQGRPVVIGKSGYQHF